MAVVIAAGVAEGLVFVVGSFVVVRSFFVVVVVVAGVIIVVVLKVANIFVDVAGCDSVDG